MNCATVRDVLPEFALGVTPDHEQADVELHIETCAACRKEAIDLQRAVAAFGFAVAPTDPPAEGLENAVVANLHRLAAPRTHGRNLRRAGVTLLAAATLVGGLGVGAVLAGRAEQSRLQSERAQLETQQMLDRFGDVLSAAPLGDPDTNVFLGALTATRGQGSGAALTIVSPNARDQVIVIVDGLPADAAPLAVRLEDTKGRSIDVGTIRRLDTSGAATLVDVVPGGLGGFVEVQARSADGQVVLRGTLAANTSVSSPSP
jgi:hypothetical protein